MMMILARNIVIVSVGIAFGLASAFYLAANYHPFSIHGTIHAIIFATGLAAIFGYYRKASRRTAALYVAGALPVHLAVHFIVIKDIIIAMPA